MNAQISGFNPHPWGADTHSTDVLLEAILEQTRLGREVRFDDDIGPDLGIYLTKNVVNMHVDDRKKAVRKLAVSHWINDSDYDERMRKRNSAEAVADLIRECGRELDAEIAKLEPLGWLP